MDPTSGLVLVVGLHILNSYTEDREHPLATRTNSLLALPSWVSRAGERRTRSSTCMTLIKGEEEFYWMECMTRFRRLLNGKTSPLISA